MKVVAAYLLAVLGGNKEPTAEDIKDILGSVGAADDADEKIQLLLSQVQGKDLTELIARGREKFASVCGGGASMAVGASVGGTSDNGGAAEQKKEEKVEEKVEEELDEEMGFSLFDDDEGY
ncbi:hypothetical protein C5167_031757 [Papaver somniferum]|uniref:60S acidic ribosomal protein P2 n=1 Tax=Papaver somniferum TaxID=3469 RepID=A0A4Y7K6Q2_PAPSO|nr:60S acidic ribosomal protein P2-like [Papaver somniferum]XP_026398411.1 60S acidic ribosomal protein P2-like [Papaver somniferum]RZC68503.1 hypothetical protein C5167_031756 [Papaver somniferum]RZC68506.1 hypothetical protein C5167_031757 [Papaver somniferum]